MKKLKLFFLFTILLFLNSCSYATGIYIQNLLETPVTLKIKFQKTYNGINMNDEISFYMLEEITDKKNLGKNKSAIELEFTQIDEQTFQIILPAKSTTEIDKSWNYNFNVDKIEFNNKKRNLGELYINSLKKNNNYIYKIQ